MILYTSIKDMLKLEPFKHMNERQLLDPKNDETILDMLYPLGVDKSKGMDIQACRHRTNDKKDVVNWRYVFEERRDKGWLNSGNASLEVRINDTKDLVLIGELVQMAGILHRTTTDGIMGAAAYELSVRQRGKKNRIIPHRDDEANEEDVVKQIRALQSIQRLIRGDLKSSEDVLWDSNGAALNLKQDNLEYESMYANDKENK